MVETYIHFLPFAGRCWRLFRALADTRSLTIARASSDRLRHSEDATVAMQDLLEVELHDPSNIIVMKKPLEKRFDNWDWTILVEGEDQYMVSQQLGATSIHCAVLARSTT